MITDADHDEKVMANVQALIAQAKHPDNTYNPSRRTRIRSSLHQFICTKEQADEFMAAIERLMNK
jgi:hypothetical protein